MESVAPFAHGKHLRFWRRQHAWRSSHLAGQAPCVVHTKRLVLQPRPEIDNDHVGLSWYPWFLGSIVVIRAATKIRDSWTRRRCHHAFAGRSLQHVSSHSVSHLVQQSHSVDVGTPCLEETLRAAYETGFRTLGEKDSAALPALDSTTNTHPEWHVESEELIADGAAQYACFKVGPIPEGQARPLGNILRRALLRQDLFRRHAAVAFRVQHRSFRSDENHALLFSYTESAKHELSAVSGVKESMIDIVRNLQNLAVAQDTSMKVKLPLTAVAAATDVNEPETWRWSVRRCGPCAVQARDLDIVDASSHYEVPLKLAEPGHHICRLTGPSVFELEVEVVCSSNVEWEESPAFKDYRRDRRSNGWLMVPPLFSPVLKVNYLITEHEHGSEAVQLEVWTKVSDTPCNVVQIAAASLLAVLSAQSEDGQIPFRKPATQALSPEPDTRRRPLDSALEQNTGDSKGDAWDELLSILPGDKMHVELRDPHQNRKDETLSDIMDGAIEAYASSLDEVIDESQGGLGGLANGLT